MDIYKFQVNLNWIIKWGVIYIIVSYHAIQNNGNILCASILVCIYIVFLNVCVYQEKIFDFIERVSIQLSIIFFYLFQWSSTVSIYL